MAIHAKAYALFQFFNDPLQSVFASYSISKVKFFLLRVRVMCDQTTWVHLTTSVTPSMPEIPDNLLEDFLPALVDSPHMANVALLKLRVRVVAPSVVLALVGPTGLRVFQWHHKLYHVYDATRS